MSIRKCKMATAILILLNSAKRETFIDVLITPQQLDSQKLRTVIGQKNQLGGTLQRAPPKRFAIEYCEYYGQYCKLISWRSHDPKCVYVLVFCIVRIL